jgi:ABC-type histidine transport system ATPase subunit
VREVLDVIEELAGTGMTMVVVTHELGSRWAGDATRGPRLAAAQALGVCPD